MKRLLKVTGIILVVLFVGIFATYKIIDNAASYDKNHDQLDNGPSIVSKAAPKQGTKQEIKEQTGKIGGVEFETGLNENSTELEVIEVMHKMTHQKVRAEDKWGAIPMSDDTINQVYDIISKSNFEQKDSLLAIIDNWKNNNFANVDLDHNFFWNLEDGTIGKAYGKMSPKEEAEFIKNNFPSES
jgi:hypothetical protein